MISEQADGLLASGRRNLALLASTCLATGTARLAQAKVAGPGSRRSGRGWPSAVAVLSAVYAMMQAVGVVNDHLAGCFARDEVAALRDAE